MKLALCPFCSDLQRLTLEKRFCACGRCWAYVKPDRLFAVFSQHAIPIGIGNESFRKAIENRPAEGLGSLFNAFVIPEKCLTIEYKKDAEETKD